MLAYLALNKAALFVTQTFTFGCTTLPQRIN